MAGGRDIKPWLRRSLTAAGEEGFSLALALLVVLGGLFTTLAITSRTIGSRQVRDSNDKSFSARNAAEIGMTRIISELNRPPQPAAAGECTATGGQRPNRGTD